MKTKRLIDLNISELIFQPSITKHKGINQGLPNKGYIYTFKNVISNNILIGFSNVLKLVSDDLNLKGYILIDKKKGSENDFKELRNVLSELGYHPSSEYQSYNYSEKLIKILGILGWPMGSFSHSKKINKYLSYKKRLN